MKYIKLEIADNPTNPDSCLYASGEYCGHLWRHEKGMPYYCSAIGAGLSYWGGAESYPVRHPSCKKLEIAR